MQAQAPFQRATQLAGHSLLQRRRDDFALIGLIDQYGAHGGLASPDEVISLMRPYWRQPISILARWILDRKLVSFYWCTQILLPSFQFERPRMTPNRAVSDCLRELGEALDDEGLASWFVRPCLWLDQRMPVDLVLNDPDLVIDAASRTRKALTNRSESH